jgi:hypothetical protein
VPGGDLAGDVLRLGEILGEVDERQRGTVFRLAVSVAGVRCAEPARLLALFLNGSAFFGGDRRGMLTNDFDVGELLEDGQNVLAVITSVSLRGGNSPQPEYLG